MISGPEEVGRPDPDPDRSPIIASLMGMLAGLGMLVLMTAVLTAGGLILNLELGLVITDGDVQVASLIGIAIAAIVIFASTLIGGFVTGRIARDGGIAAGIGASLWLTLVLAVFAALAFWVASASNALEGLDLADRLPGITTTALATTAAITGGGLFVLALLGGSLGGRFGETERQRTAQKVVDIREAESESTEARAEVAAETQGEVAGGQTDTAETHVDQDEVSA